MQRCITRSSTLAGFRKFLWLQIFWISLGSRKHLEFLCRPAATAGTLGNIASRINFPGHFRYRSGKSQPVLYFQLRNQDKLICASKFHAGHKLPRDIRIPTIKNHSESQDKPIRLPFPNEQTAESRRRRKKRNDA